MGSPAGFRFSGRALIIIGVAALVISGLLLFVAPDTGTQVLVTEVDESVVSPDDEVLRYSDLSEGGQELFDQGLRADEFIRVYQSPPDFEYPTGDTSATALVEKNGTVYSIITASRCKLCGLVDALGYGAGLAGIVLLVLGVYRLVNEEADPTADNR
ncbi:hypothetical protein BVU17_06090 [Haloarcula taiwanensis]|uniref:DUF7979 domain-containing protein n=1 Tax=Haloarcula taiwanensis TaxID=1932004 RepID=A0A2H4ZXA8_9EURY|nr:MULTISPECIES: hypothetical protein [Haloarcula]AUG47118.1 hypothetical protein BVU17_06090 [Haloarcula taiwanensis]RLM42237.1 hypothetical protein DVK00_17740 [Haloarcula sp. Atlit-47R]